MDKVSNFLIRITKDKKLIVLIFSFGLIWLFVGLIFNLSLELYLLGAIGSLNVGILLTIFYLDGRQNKALDKQDLIYTQHEAWLNLSRELDFALPLPFTRGWAASPDFLQIIVNEIIEKKPSLIVECGSGISSLIIGYALKEVGKGRLISMEENEAYQEKTKEMIHGHGLSEFVEVLFAPLQHEKYKSGSLKWYSLSKVNIDLPIDMLIVDGPKLMANRPLALPMLDKYMAKKSIIIVDDTKWKFSKKMIAEWCNSFGYKSFEISAEKGAALLYRS